MMMKKESFSLALDIGGTNCRLGIVRRGKRAKLVSYVKVPTKEVKNLTKEIKDFLKANKKYDISNAGIGFAGPITGNKAKLTNSILSIDRKKLEKELKIPVILVNDFYAFASSIKSLKRKDLLVLNETRYDNGIQMVTGPGTGLGKAYIFNDTILPCEAGLTTLGVEDIHEYNLLDFIRKKRKLKYVYYEDVISGRGLENIYDYLEMVRDIKIDEERIAKIKNFKSKRAELITKYASKDPLCDETLKLFTKFYAQFVRNSVLSMLSSHVYLCGGISPAIKKYLKKYFMNEFIKHRKYSSLLKKITISIVLNDKMGLIGAGTL